MVKLRNNQPFFEHDTFMESFLKNVEPDCILFSQENLIKIFGFPEKLFSVEDNSIIHDDDKIVAIKEEFEFPDEQLEEISDEIEMSDIMPDLIIKSIDEGKKGDQIEKCHVVGSNYYSRVMALR